VDMCDCLHVSAGCVMASHTGKFLRATIIAARARGTRLRDMCDARTYPPSQPIGRTLDSQPAPVRHVRVHSRHDAPAVHVRSG